MSTEADSGRVDTAVTSDPVVGLARDLAACAIGQKIVTNYGALIDVALDFAYTTLGHDIDIIERKEIDAGGIAFEVTRNEAVTEAKVPELPAESLGSLLICGHYLRIDIIPPGVSPLSIPEIKVSRLRTDGLVIATSCIGLATDAMIADLEPLLKQAIRSAINMDEAEDTPRTTEVE